MKAFSVSTLDLRLTREEDEQVEVNESLPKLLRSLCGSSTVTDICFNKEFLLDLDTSSNNSSSVALCVVHSEYSEDRSRLFCFSDRNSDIVEL